MENNIMLELYNSLLIKYSELQKEVDLIKKEIEDLKSGNSVNDKSLNNNVIKKNKYVKIREYLENSNMDEITCSIDELDKMVRISEVCYKNEKNIRLAFSNTKSHSLALSWLGAGYKVSGITFDRECLKNTLIKFTKIK